MIDERPVGAAGDIVPNHPGAPDILPFQPRLPEIGHHHGDRRANFLAGEKLKVRQLLTGGDTQTIPPDPAELGAPLPRPAEHGDPPLVSGLNIEIRRVEIHRTSAGGRQPAGGPGRKRRFQRHPVVDPYQRTGNVVKEEFVLTIVVLVHPEIGLPPAGRLRREVGTPEMRIERENRFDNRGVPAAGVLKEQLPFDRGKIEIFLYFAADLKRAVRLGKEYRPMGDLSLGFDRVGSVPRFQKGAAWLAAVDERKGEIGRIGIRFPVLHQRDLVEPQRPAVVERDRGLPPVGVVARNSVPRVGDHQRHTRELLQRKVDRNGRLGSAHHLRSEQFLVAVGDDENNAPGAVMGGDVGIDPDFRLKSDRRPIQFDLQMAHGVAVEPAGKFGLTDLQRLSLIVEQNRVVVLNHRDPGQRRLLVGGRLEFRRREPLFGVHLLLIGGEPPQGRRRENGRKNKDGQKRFLHQCLQSTNKAFSRLKSR